MGFTVHFTSNFIHTSHKEQRGEKTHTESGQLAAVNWHKIHSSHTLPYFCAYDPVSSEWKTMIVSSKSQTNTRWKQNWGKCYWTNNITVPPTTTPPREAKSQLSLKSLTKYLLTEQVFSENQQYQCIMHGKKSRGSNLLTLQLFLIYSLKFVHKSSVIQISEMWWGSNIIVKDKQ